MGFGSVSRVAITLEISGNCVAQGVIARHYSPITSSALLRSLPMQKRLNKFKDRFVYVETELVLGREKQKANFKKGELAFMTLNGSICLFLKDTVATPMNPVGLITTHLELLETLRPGNLLTIRRVP